MLDELRSRPAGLANYFQEEARDERETHCPKGVTPLATWWQQRTGGTAYIRCSVPARHLPGQSLALHYSDVKVGSDGEVIVPRHQGAGIFQFVGNATRALIMAHLQEQGAKVLMEVDDNYLRPSPDPTRTEWLTKIDRSENDRYSFPAHRKIIRWVDGVIVSTEELAERYAQKTQAPIYHCPNSADLDDWPVLPESAGRPGTARNIGFAGSSSHRYDMSLVERPLDWAVRNGATLYRFGGTGDWNFEHVATPWTDDLAQYRRSLQVLDVGLCPLKQGDWQDCKSDLKAIEYTLAGAIPIISKVPPYKDWFDIVPTCATEKDWLKALKWAVRAPADELYDVWRRAYDLVVEHKIIQKNIHLWRTAIE